MFDRFSHNCIDLQTFRTIGHEAPARDVLVRAYAQHSQTLKARGHQLPRLRQAQGHLPQAPARRTARTQDTNLLQEESYFGLYGHTQGSIFIVVGDDDKSPDRFRGATVELFRDFENRLRTAIPNPSAGSRLQLPLHPEARVPLQRIHRQRPGLHASPVNPAKPKIQAQLPSIGLPVLGMFRDSTEEFAEHLSTLLIEMFRGPGRPRSETESQPRLPFFLREQLRRSLANPPSPG